MTRALLAVVAVVAAWAALGASALGYGTSTTYASSSAGTPPGVWAGVAGAGSASDGDAAATLTETDAAGLPAVLHPVNRAFAAGASGWSLADTGAALCSVSSAHTSSDGNPAGSLRASYGTLLNLGGLLASCSSAWTSDAFTWTDGAPASVAFSMDRLIDVNGVLGVTVSWQARLVDETVPGQVTLVSGSSAADSGWTTQSAAGLPAGAIVSGHTYRIRIDVTFETVLGLLSGIGFGADNVVLAVTPQDRQASGELGATGVPAGTTHTLELRARTTGEPFDVQVWNGATWTTRGTVSAAAPAWDAISHGLTVDEWNGGTVRTRFVATGSGADAVTDALSVEHLRVVATGGITVSGPTSVTLPAVVIDGLSDRTSGGPLGAIEVEDTGGSASGWSLQATATRWTLDGAPGELLPATAFSAAPTAPTTPDGSDLTGVSAGAGGIFDTSVPITLMSAAAGRGVGTYRQNPGLSLVVPVTALHGVYRSDITLSAY